MPFISLGEGFALLEDLEKIIFSSCACFWFCQGKVSNDSVNIYPSWEYLRQWLGEGAWQVAGARGGGPAGCWGERTGPGMSLGQEEETRQVAGVRGGGQTWETLQRLQTCLRPFLLHLSKMYHRVHILIKKEFIFVVFMCAMPQALLSPCAW